MTTPVQGHASTELRKGALGVGFIVFFVISAAGPLTAVAGGMPIGFLLGNGAGLPSRLLFVIALRLMFSPGTTRSNSPNRKWRFSFPEKSFRNG